MKLCVYVGAEEDVDGPLEAEGRVHSDFTADVTVTDAAWLKRRGFDGPFTLEKLARYDGVTRLPFCEYAWSWPGTRHRCVECGCIWRENDDGSWSLWSQEQEKVMGKCCDNSADFLEKLEPLDRATRFERSEVV